MKLRLTLLNLLLSAAGVVALCEADDVYKMELSLKGHTDGYYKLGENIECVGRLLKNGEPLKDGRKCHCNILFNMHGMQRIEFVADGEYHTFSHCPDQNGWTLFMFGFPDGSERKMANYNMASEDWGIGAMTGGDQIRSTSECPQDFKEYWDKEIKKETSLPLDVKYEPLPVPKNLRDKVELYNVTINSTTDYPVTGYLGVPKNHAGKMKALIEYQCFWFHDADRNTAMNYAAKGVLTFSATWHGLPCGKDQAYYDEQGKTYVKGDPLDVFINFQEREKWSFYGTYLRVFRILQFVKSRPEWDGRNLAVMGGSLGGMQSIVAASDKDVTLAVITIPAFNQLDSWLSESNDLFPPEVHERIRTKDKSKILDNARYFDCVNFGRLIRCETYFSTGFIDVVCPPNTVFACYNSLPATTKKTMTTHPQGGHGGLSGNTKGLARLEKYCQE